MNVAFICEIKATFWASALHQTEIEKTICDKHISQVINKCLSTYPFANGVIHGHIGVEYDI